MNFHQEIHVIREQHRGQDCDQGDKGRANTVAIVFHRYQMRNELNAISL
jgi:hypothetical protein